MPKEIISKEALDSLAVYSGLGGLGGLIHYLDQVRKGERFKAGFLIINVLISTWLVGFVIGPLFPEEWSLKTHYAIASMSGFLSYYLIKIIESRGLQLILDKLGIKK